MIIKLIVNFNVSQCTVFWILKTYVHFFADLWEFYLPYLYSCISLMGCLLLLCKYFSGLLLMGEWSSLFWKIIGSFPEEMFLKLALHFFNVKINFDKLKPWNKTHVVFFKEFSCRETHTQAHTHWSIRLCFWIVTYNSVGWLCGLCFTCVQFYSSHHSVSQEYCKQINVGVRSEDNSWFSTPTSTWNVICSFVGFLLFLLSEKTSSAAGVLHILGLLQPSAVCAPLPVTAVAFLLRKCPRQNTERI